jgi:hypothetical protein
MRACVGVVGALLLIDSGSAVQAATLADMQYAVQMKQCPARRAANTSPEQICRSDVYTARQMPNCQYEIARRQQLINAYNRLYDACNTRTQANLAHRSKVSTASPRLKTAAAPNQQAAKYANATKPAQTVGITKVGKPVQTKIAKPAKPATTTRSAAKPTVPAASASTRVAANTVAPAPSPVAADIGSPAKMPEAAGNLTRSIGNAPPPPPAPKQFAVSALEPPKMNRCTDQQLDWAQMTSADQQLWSALGWTQARWDSDKPSQAPASESKSWSELSDTERRAASQLGFNWRNWDIDCKPNPKPQKIEPAYDLDD